MITFINGMIEYISQNISYILEQAQIHAAISLTSVLLCILIGIPIGILLNLFPKYADLVINIVNTIQTVPSMAMLIIMLIIFGLGTQTVIITIIFYSILPIIKNTYVGLNSIDPIYLDNAKGLGMTPWQTVYKIKLPLSLPIILAGIKNALVIAVGTTVIGSFVGAGGLGDIILRGINTVEGNTIVLTGVIFCILITIIFELAINIINKIFLDN
ncbi:ABC transporter permease [Vagococcus fluvialis]|uniref:ABC transporter permease n=1 Tax=Vagococcus fluvialis TaxID=2738 RepID=UPI001D0B82F2|nr:ABC transporter permease [Vagococcus fluvialis]UDM80383.1 ABC transporter permease [Vagococcus fluvialis]